MRSVRLVYDAEGDILDVDFRLTGERPRRGIELHDNVTIWTDAEEKNILRLMLLSYAQLCVQPTLTLNKLQKMPVDRRAKLLKLLTTKPVKRFLVSVDEKKCRFRIAEPGLREVAAA
jgi:hypothetical protein